MTTSLGYALFIWLAAGALCGWLETRRLPDGLHFTANLTIGIAGAVLAGIFFKAMGELGPAWQGPIYSGFIGAAVLLAALGPLLRRFKWV